jgi:hypothetical protein
MMVSSNQRLESVPCEAVYVGSFPSSGTVTRKAIRSDSLVGPHKRLFALLIASAALSGSQRQGAGKSGTVGKT